MLVSGAFRDAAARVVFAFSTIVVRMPAAPPAGAGGEGFKGLTGRARYDFPSTVAGRTGDLECVCEFADLGDSTSDGLRLAREVVRDGGSGGPRGLFLGLSTSSFSLSIDISSL